jgi:thiamine pyrophosphokinase
MCVSCFGSGKTLEDARDKDVTNQKKYVNNETTTVVNTRSLSNILRP